MIPSEVAHRIVTSFPVTKNIQPAASRLTLERLKSEDFFSLTRSRGVLYVRSKSGLASYLPIPSGWPGAFGGMVWMSQSAAQYKRSKWGKLLPCDDNSPAWAWRGKRFKTFSYHAAIPLPESSPHQEYPWEDRHEIESKKALMQDWGKSVRKDHRKLRAFGFPSGLIPTGEEISIAIANENEDEANATLSRDTDFDSIGNGSWEPRSARTESIAWSPIVFVKEGDSDEGKPVVIKTGKKEELCSSQTAEHLIDEGWLKVKSSLGTKLIPPKNRARERIRFWKGIGMVVSREIPLGLEK